VRTKNKGGGKGEKNQEKKEGNTWSAIGFPSKKVGVNKVLFGKSSAAEMRGGHSTVGDGRRGPAARGK